MIVDTGLSVTVRTWFRIASPLFGSFVSTSTTPPCVTNTVVFPPAPGITYRLSRTFLIVPVGGIRGRCCCAAAPATARPTTTIAERSLLRAIRRSGRMNALVGLPELTDVHYTIERLKRAAARSLRLQGCLADNDSRRGNSHPFAKEVPMETRRFVLNAAAALAAILLQVPL